MSMTKKCGKHLLIAFLTVALVFTMIPLNPIANANVSAAENEGLTVVSPAVVVTGQGLIGGDSWTADNVSKEKSYSLDELKALDGVKGQLYSGRKSKEPFARTYNMVDGVKISSLVGKEEAGTNQVSVFAEDGYAVSFKSDATYVNDGKGKNKPGLFSGRYYYDGFKGSGVEVPAVIAWAYSEEKDDNGNPPEKKPTSAEPQKNLRLYAGQYGQLDAEGSGKADDMNQPLYNGGDAASVNKVQVGDSVNQVVMTIGSKEYTRADILLMPYAERAYTYTTKGGETTDYVRGVPMSVILKAYKDDTPVKFTAADGYDVKATGMTKKELVAGNYMLAYAAGPSATEMTGIFKTAKNDPSITGVFSLYGDGGSPASMVDSITAGIDYKNSPYKHITNGGIKGQDAPYNIDTITGATLTVEGPGTKSSVPLPVRDLESQDAGCARGTYYDYRDGKKTTRTYEGIDIYYILNNMQSGDNGIKLTDNAYSVAVKNRNRKTISTFTIAQIKKMHDAGTPILVAYGTSYKNKVDTAKPFVFDDGAGGDKTLGNYDGCLKLVYDMGKIKSNKKYKKFGNMAYIYVKEKATPGYKHNKAPYKSAENSQYVVTVTGKGVGREVNFTVKQLENMVKYKKNGKLKKNRYAYRAQYSLANSTYWYVNEYEGVKLWSLLRSSGIKDSKKSDKKTMVTFQSTDNYKGFDTFSLYQIAHPKTFGFYEKNALDPGDGSYIPNENIRKNNDPATGDKLKAGCPVLVAYGVNGYPYVKNNKLKGYLSGLQNDGGPLRIISGKMDYNHANGSNQAKYLEKIVVGSNDYHYATHTYHEKKKYKNLADDTIRVKVTSDGETLKKASYSVEELESLLYDGNLTATQLSEAKVKNFYETKSGKKFKNDLYEGVNLSYFLSSVVQLQGSRGRITFTSESGKSMTKDLDTVLETNNGYNKATKLSGLSPVIAYAKNGAPLVTGKKSSGYEGTVTLSKKTPYARKYKVNNSGGPLKVVFPRANKKATNTMGTVDNLMSITIDLTADKYAHTAEPYNAYAENTFTVSGEGSRIADTKAFTVTDLEGKQKMASTVDYSVKKGSSAATQQRYRGISLYSFLSDTAVGLKNNADQVIVKGTNGKTYTFNLADLIKGDYTNTATGKKVPVMLAYGSANAANSDVELGKPLVEKTSSEGYDKDFANDGGPIKLVFGQVDANDTNGDYFVTGVKSIEITAKESKSWNHSSNAVYEQYLSWDVELQVLDANKKELFDKHYSVGDLEKMTNLISQDSIQSTQENVMEGLNFWKFVVQETKAKVPNIDTNPVTAYAYAKSDNYRVELISKVGLDALQNGVKDGTKYVPVMLAYGMDEFPLVPGDKSDTKVYDGFNAVIGNNGGPIRLMVHKSQGSCLTEVYKIVITVK